MLEGMKNCSDCVDLIYSSINQYEVHLSILIVIFNIKMDTSKVEDLGKWAGEEFALFFFQNFSGYYFMYGYESTTKL